MADINSDDDPDSAAMAEAMGFAGFGMQRGATRKRKLATPPAQTGANNAPLGKRRPLNLPQPVVASGGGAVGGGDGGGGGNAEEIGLDDEDDEDELAGAQGGGGEGEEEGVEEDIRTQEAGLDALSFSDAPSAATAGHRQHQQHQLPPKPQQQQNHHHAGKAARHPKGGRAGAPGPGPGLGQVPWWEREWDLRLVDRMVENPWDRLERQRGLGARGTWPTARGPRGGGGGNDAPALAGAGAGPAWTDGSGAGAVGSFGGIEQAARATVS